MAGIKLVLLTLDTTLQTQFTEYIKHLNLSLANVNSNNPMLFTLQA